MREVAFTVALSGDPVAEFLAVHGGAQASYSISVSGDIAWQTNVYRGEPKAVDRFVREVIPDPGPLKVEARVIERGQEEVAYFMRWRRPRSGGPVSVPHLALAAVGEAHLLYSETSPEARHYRLYVSEGTDLRPLHKALRTQLGTRVTVAAVRPSPLPGRAVQLTPLQEKVLREAVARGYYAIPHRVGLKELAKRLGIPMSTVAYNLRRAESAVILERDRQKYPGRE